MSYFPRLNLIKEIIVIIVYFKTQSGGYLKQVFCSENRLAVQRVKDLLDFHQIPCFVKNEYALGELGRSLLSMPGQKCGSRMRAGMIKPPNLSLSWKRRINKVLPGCVVTVRKKMTPASKSVGTVVSKPANKLSEELPNILKSQFRQGQFDERFIDFFS